MRFCCLKRGHFCRTCNGRQCLESEPSSRLHAGQILGMQQKKVAVHHIPPSQGAFDAYAMGNYPYPSSYINGDDTHPLPAWPMRAACQLMTQCVCVCARADRPIHAPVRTASPRMDSGKRTILSGCLHLLLGGVRNSGIDSRIVQVLASLAMQSQKKCTSKLLLLSLQCHRTKSRGRARALNSSSGGP
eukprot:1159067-Pelagomonas_calceolata.AAC.14